MKTLLKLLLFIVLAANAAFAADFGRGKTITIEPRDILDLFKKGKQKPKLDDEEKPLRKIPALVFEVDPRWKSWASNKVALADSIQLADQKGDFLRARALQFKLAYAEYFLSLEEADAESAKEVSRLEEQRPGLLKRRDVQLKFENQSAVAAIDKEIAALDRAIAFTQKRKQRSPYDLVTGLMRSCASPAGTLLRVAHLEHIEGMPYTADSGLVPEIRQFREHLAYAASGTKTPERVQEEALALNRQLKILEDDLMAARFVDAQKLALRMAEELLDR